jgi:peroxiredoxin
MRTLALHALLAGAAAAVALRAQQSNDPSAKDPSAKDPAAQEPLTQAPDVAFDGVNGKVALRDFRGKQAVVLLFMRGFAKGMTCYYCGEQTREYASRYAEIHAAGAEVLMVLPLADDIAGYVRKIGEGGKPPDPQLALPFPVVLDKDGSACAALRVPTKKSGLDPFPVANPATIVVGKDGKVLFERHGDDPSDRPDVAAVLQVLRTGTAAPAATKAAAAPVASRAWLGYEDGLRAAKAGRRPILLEFHAVW